MSLLLIEIANELRERKWKIPGSEDVLVCKYKYFRILTNDLGYSYNLRWFLTSNPSKNLTKGEIQTYFPNKQPRLNIWEHYALLLIIGLVIFLTFLGF